MFSLDDYNQLSKDEQNLLIVGLLNRNNRIDVPARPMRPSRPLRNYKNLATTIGSGYLDPLIMQGYVPAVQSIIKKYGNETITSMTIVRTPLSKVLTMALNAVSFGNFAKVQKKNDYDSYFHLHLHIGLASGTMLILEKNEVINIEKGTNKTKDSETMSISNVPSITLNELLEKTKVKQGAKFFNYNSSSNCQQFIKDVLLSIGINNQSYIDFVRQDTESIFKNKPIFRKIANSATDLGASMHTVQWALTSHPVRLPSAKKIARKITKFFGGADGTTVDY